MGGGQLITNRSPYPLLTLVFGPWLLLGGDALGLDGAGLVAGVAPPVHVLGEHAELVLVARGQPRHGEQVEARVAGPGKVNK